MHVFTGISQSLADFSGVILLTLGGMFAFAFAGAGVSWIARAYRATAANSRAIRPDAKSAGRHTAQS